MSEKKPNLITADDLQPILKFIGKNWLLMVFLPAIALIAAFFYIHRLPNIYAARTEILLKSADTYDYQSQIYSTLGQSVLQDVTNQQRLLQSYDLIEKTIKELDYTVSYYLVGRIKTQQVPRFGAFSIDLQWRNVIRYLFGVPIDIKVLDENHYQLSYEALGKFYKRRFAFNEEAACEHIRLTLYRNDELINPQNIEEIKGQNFRITVSKPHHLVDKYRAAIVIKNIDKTSILSVTVTDELEGRPREFLETLSNTYIESTLASQIKINTNTRQYIDKQIIELEAILDSLGREIEIFRNTNQILDLEKEQIEYFKNLSALDQEAKKLEMRYSAIESLEEFLYRGLDEAVLSPAFYMFEEDLFLQQQVNELFNLKVERSQKLINFTEENIEIQKLDSLVHTVNQGIFKYTSDTKVAIANQAKNVQNQITALELRLQKIPKSQRDIIAIERKLKINESLYEFLLQNKASTVIARAALIPQTTIIENARSMGIVGPNKEKYIYLSFAFGLFTAIIIGVIRMVFFERIENLKELKSLSSIPVLGGIPEYHKANTDPITILQDSRSNISEAYRALRTNLQYSLPKEKKNIFLITSLHPGEGKTFNSTNISSIFAKAGTKTLLLDFDLHKPKVHKNFGLENTQGVSTFLMGRALFEDIVHHSLVDELDVITAGPVPHNASELILSDKVPELLEISKTQYDLIIIDTPPLMLISDSLVLLKYADISIFVMNTNLATQQGVHYLEEVLSQNNIQHSSLLLNNVKQKRWKYYYGKYASKYGLAYGYHQGYGSGYGYGYGYGYGSKKDK